MEMQAEYVTPTTAPVLDASVPETTHLARESSSILDRANAIEIDSNESYEAAGMVLLRIKNARTKIDELWNPVIQKAHAAHKAAIDSKNKLDGPLSQAEGIIKPKLAAWDREQRRKAREEQERAEAEARRQAEDAQLAQAIAAEKAGDKIAADQIIAEPLQIAPVIRRVETPKVAGISYSTIWKCRVTNFQKLVEAVASGKVPLTMIQADESALNKAASAMKSMMAWPGVEAYSEQVVRGARK